MRLRDSRTGELHELHPGSDGTIGMYVCGPTVYGRIHVGNARPFVVFGLMKRYLEWREQPVTLVENITDVNDKIYTAAQAQGVASADLAREMAAAYIADTDRLGIGRPDREPLASETLDEIVALIAELVASGHAYEADGDVYFAVRSFAPYGELSGQRPDELRAGARVEPGEHKRDPLDFALWKATKPEEDTRWQSPWGDGRPGWHIECSAMAEKLLGPRFEVHGGGRDLIFPHHENEVAQSGAAGRPFARVWAHNGMLRLSGEKMSKSLGNIDGLAEALDRWGAETFIMFLLQAHYASPVDYDDEALERARAACATLRNRLRSGSGADAGLRAAVCEALDDDFIDAAGARAALPGAADGARHGRRGARRARPRIARPRRAGAGRACVALARERQAARDRRDFAESDRAARRDRRARLGGARRRRRLRALPARWLRSSTAGGRCARRCAAGARWARCGARPAWARRSSGCPATRARPMPTSSPSGRAAPTTRAWWPRCADYRYADAAELLAARAPAAGRARRGHRSAQPGRGRAGRPSAPGPTAS